MADLQTLKVADLKEILKKHNLPVNGFKKDLIERLTENGITGDEVDANKEESTPEDSEVTEIPRVEDQPAPAPVSAPNTATATYTTTSVEPQPEGSNAVYESSSVSTVTETVQIGNEPPKSVERKVVSETVPTGVADHGSVGESTTTTTTTTVSATNFSKEELKAKAVELLNVKIKRATKFGELEEADRLSKDLKRIEKFGFDPTTSIAKDLGLFKRDRATVERSGNGRVKKNNNHRRGSNGSGKGQKKQVSAGRR
ncbi:hypothetical protein ACO0QE_004522 [Hanseniaspora vineae]